MIIKLEREQGAKYSHYCIDGKRISSNGFMTACRKYLTNVGVMAVLRKVHNDGECRLDLDLPDENQLLTEKVLELQAEHEKNAALEKRLAKAIVKAARYDGLLGVMKA